MPCRDSGEDAQERNETQRKLDKVTRLLCYNMRRDDAAHKNEVDPFDIDLSRELVEWWTNHKKEDERRRKEIEALNRAEIVNTERIIRELQEKLNKLKGIT